MSAGVIAEFETEFARWIGLGTTFAFWKGRVALYGILRALGVKEGDEVILPGYTCVMNVNPIKYVGAKPIYADIDPVTYNVQPEEIEKKITPRTRVILAQHTYGYPCDMDGILVLAKRHGIDVVEDCCLALGSTYKGKRCGTFGRAAYWSFQWNKPFTTGLGGLAGTSDPELAQKIRKLCQEELQTPSGKAVAMLAMERFVHRALIYPRTTALVARMFRWLTHKGVVVGSSSMAEFSPVKGADFFAGMSPSQARAGLRQVRRVERNLAHRRQMRQTYDDLLRQAGWDVPELPATIDPILVRYPVRVGDKQRAVAEAPGRFVEIGTWFECPLHPIETPMERYDYQPGMCPVAEQACAEVVNLPMHRRAGLATARRSVALVAGIGQAHSQPSEK